MSQAGEGYRPGPPPLPTSQDKLRAGPPPGLGPLCPACGARRVTTAGERCWLCEEALPPLDAPLARSPVDEARESALGVLGLIVLLLGLVFLGMAMETPGVALLLLLPMIPALIRASIATRRAEAYQGGGGQSFFANFMVSLGLVALVAAAAGVAFFATCFAVCLGLLAAGSFNRGGEGAMVASIALGIPPGIAVFVWLIRKVWPKKAAR